MLLETLFRLNGLDFNGYFKDCKSKNTRDNHPYKMQTNSAKVNSLKYSFFVKIIKDTGTIYQTTSLLMKLDCPTF